MSKITVADKKCTTPKFRLSYPNLFEPKAYKKQDPKFSLTMLFPKTTDLAALKKAVFKAKVEAFGKDKSEWPRMRSPFRDGDTDPSKKGKKEYKGQIFISASAKADKPPGIVGRDRQAILDKKEIYAGCYCRATLIAFVYGKDDAMNRGVSFALQNVQKWGDGKKFSGKPDAENDFDEIEDVDGEDTEEDEDDEDGFDFG